MLACTPLVLYLVVCATWFATCVWLGGLGCARPQFNRFFASFLSWLAALLLSSAAPADCSFLFLV